MTRLAVLAAGLAFAACSAPGLPSVPVLTTAERSGYTATSSTADIDAFLDAVATPGSAVHRTHFGVSGQGRELPLVVWNAPAADAASVRATGRTRVLIVANIHGGEVAGKEAALTLIRDLAVADADGLGPLTVLVAPLYNADGNDAMATDNRPLQLGPTDGMGQRPNAAGLDLNRDLMKAAAPETRALLRLFTDYDPHVVLDLHTTNGTAMAYGLTYAPGLSPNTPAGLDDYARADLLPGVTDDLLADFDLATYHYGNVPGAFGEPATAPRAWYSFSPDPRFLTNYVGLRGRLAILSEAYSYSTFRDRVHDTRRFVDAVLARVAADADRVKALAEAADRSVMPGDSLALRGEYAALPEPVEILLSRVDTVAHPVTGAPMRRRTGEVFPETMPAFVRFTPGEVERVPSAYLVRDPDGRVAEVFEAHGIPFERVPRPTDGVERFRVDSVAVASRPFQGVRMQTAHGAWAASDTEMSASLLLRVEPTGPLARVVFMLLEPRSTDGLVAWGVLRETDGIEIYRIP